MCTDKNNKADLLMILFQFTYSFFKCWKTTSLWLWSFQSSSLINLLCKIKPNYTSHSYKKRKDSLETRIVDIFAWTWNIWVGRTENTSKQKKKKKWWLLWRLAHWKWLWDCFSHFLLLWWWWQRFWGSSEDRYRSKRMITIASRVI